MNEKTHRLIHWTPRVLAIGYAAFISLFALDVWGMDGSFLERLGGFLIHLAPTYVVVALIIAAWIRPSLGGVLFCLLAAVFTILFRWDQHLDIMLYLAAPLLITGVLFVLDGQRQRNHLQPGF